MELVGAPRGSKSEIYKSFPKHCFLLLKWTLRGLDWSCGGPCGLWVETGIGGMLAEGHLNIHTHTHTHTYIHIRQALPSVLDPLLYFMILIILVPGDRGSVLSLP